MEEFDSFFPKLTVALVPFMVIRSHDPTGVDVDPRSSPEKIRKLSLSPDGSSGTQLRSTRMAEKDFTETATNKTTTADPISLIGW
jgi:hypothetical protein